MLFFEIIHSTISPVNPWATTVPYQPRKGHSTFHFATHPNDVQHVHKQRSAHFDCQSFDGHESLGNHWNSILVTWSDSILSIFFKSVCAIASHQIIMVIINHYYIGISIQKQPYNSILYKNVCNQRFFNTFWYNYHDSSNINLYGPILVWEYVYIVYLSNLSAGDANIAQ